MLKDYENIDFDVIREDWNEYKIKDGSRIKMKFVMIKILKNKKAPMGEDYRFNCNQIVGIISPLQESGNPTKIQSPQELIDSVIEEDIKINPVKDDWNEYLLRDGNKVNAKPIITLVQKTDKFDDFGDRIYNIQAQAIFKAVPKKRGR
jgi:hypothetical protein